MSRRVIYREIVILPSINEDEQECSMDTTSQVINITSEQQLSITKDNSSKVVSWDHLRSTSNSQSTTEMHDYSSQVFSKEVEGNAEQNQLSELVENIPPTNMSFFDRFIHQLTRPATSKVCYSDDDVFVEVDQSEITTAISDNTKIDGNKSTDDNSLIHIIRLFLEDLNKETNVIRGRADKDVFLNRSNHNEKSSLMITDDNRITSF